MRMFCLYLTSRVTCDGFSFTKETQDNTTQIRRKIGDKIYSVYDARSRKLLHDEHPSLGGYAMTFIELNKDLVTINQFSPNNVSNFMF